MGKIKRITIGISAYNEEKNITNVIKKILTQNLRGYEIAKIMVFSDGSTDNTVAKVKSLRSRKVKVFDDKARLGKTARIQQLFRVSSGQVILMLDADINIESKNLINQIMSGFFSDKVVLVAGNTIPLKPKTFIERAVYSTFRVFYNSRLSIRHGSNLFACTGGCLAIRRSYAKTISFPNIKNQDTYLYFKTIQDGFKFVFVEQAKVYYKLPKTLSDYLSQVFRSNPEAVELNLKEYFGDLVAKEYERGRFFYAKEVLKSIIHDPLPTIFIIIVNFLCKPFFKYKSRTKSATWEPVFSTK